MSLYFQHNHGRFMLLRNIVRHKTLDTIKSKNDERNNQTLLKRLKNLSVIGAKKSVPQPDPKVLSEEVDELPQRQLPMEKLQKLVCSHQTDPLTWNASVLARIYKIPEDYCSKLVVYVRPMIYWNDTNQTTKLVSTNFVCDVARLKIDENYLVSYRKIVFPKHSQKLHKKALTDLNQEEQQRVLESLYRPQNQQPTSSISQQQSQQSTRPPKATSSASS